jgi:mono/diheme cytochrome c family protein
VDHRPAAADRAVESRCKRGQKRYNIYCAPCHGYDGRGNGTIRKRSEEVGGVLATSPNMVEPGAKRPLMPNGQLFNVISNGFNTMAGYAAQIPHADRWAIVLYVRALQRAQNASAADAMTQVTLQRDHRHRTPCGPDEHPEMSTAHPATRSSRLARWLKPVQGRHAAILVIFAAICRSSWASPPTMTLAPLLSTRTRSAGRSSTSLVIGALFFVIIHHLVRARSWSTVVRRIAEIVTLTFPLLFVAGLGFIIPLAPVARTCTTGATTTPATRSLNHHLHGKLGWLEPRLRSPSATPSTSRSTSGWPRTSRERRASRTRAGTKRCRRSCASLPVRCVIVFALTTIFFGFDIIMSLQPKWYSTIYSVNFFGGAMIGAYATLTLLCMYGAAHRPPDAVDQRRALPGPRQVDLGLHVLLGLHGVLAVHAVLVRQHSRGDDLLQVPHVQRAGRPSTHPPSSATGRSRS